MDFTESIREWVSVDNRIKNIKKRLKRKEYFAQH